MPQTHKLHPEALDAYANQAAKAVCEAFFRNKEGATGPQLMELCPIRQVNLLVMRNLYDRWQREMSRLRSPYFDYSHTEVTTALRSFMNLLSQHIYVRRAELEVLVKEAIWNTFMLAFEPVDYFKREIETLANPMVPIPALKELGRYILVNKELLTTVLSDLEYQRHTEMFAGELQRYFLKAQLDFQKQNKLFNGAELAEQFQSIAPLSLAEIWVRDEPEEETFPPFRGSFFESIDKEAAPAPAPVAEVEAQTEPETPAESAPEAEPEAVLPTEAPVEEAEATPAPALEEAPKPETPEPPAAPQVIAQAPPRIESVPRAANPPVPTAQQRSEEERSGVLSRLASLVKGGKPEHLPSPSEIIAAHHKQGLDISHTVIPDVPLKDRLTRPEPSLKDRISEQQQAPDSPSSPEAPSLQSTIAQAQGSLKERIGLNDRFTFIAELFAGDAQAYNAALDALDAMKSHRQAVDAILNTYALTHNWDFNHPAPNRFMELVEQRFA